MKSKQVSKAVTARFSLQDYLSLQEEAEKRGCTIADIIRKSWSMYKDQKQISQHLSRFEQRQRATNFEMLCSVIGLQDGEREQALLQLKQRGVKW